VRAAFSENVHGRSVASIKNYWQRQIFSGRNVPPPEFSDDSAMVAHVQSDPGAVGYVSPSASLGSGVKRIRVTE
jgi:ABC-type phosphate transport system substrate-binding protein